jgi:cytochrome oxidase Cu insertion factor (SCO1/SenC/PrrC family)
MDSLIPKIIKMEFKFSILLSVAITSFYYTHGQNSYNNIKARNIDNREKTTVSFQLSAANYGDSINVGYHKLVTVGYAESKSINLNLVNGLAKWVIQTDEPHYLQIPFLSRRQNTTWLTEPGDDVTVFYDGSHIKFSGQGSEKYKLQAKIWAIKDSLKRQLSNPNTAPTVSVQDYLEWNEYCNKQLTLILPVLEEYKAEISAFSFKELKDRFLDGILNTRTDKFYTFLGYARITGMSLQSICEIYDSTYALNTRASVLPSMSRNFLGSWGNLRLEIGRKYNFNQEEGGYNTRLKRHMQYYELGLRRFSGLVREKFLLEFLTDKMIKDFGFIPEVEAALARYYAEPGYPEYKQYVKNYELKLRELKSGMKAPDFSLMDVQGKTFKKEDIKGKIALIDFWFTGCVGCVQMAASLKRIENEFRGDPNVVFLNVSIDKGKDKWLKSVEQAQYTSGQGISLYTGGVGDDHEMIKAYNVSSYPTLYMIDAYGRLIHSPLPRDEKLIINAIREQLVLLKDGPYVVKQQETTKVISINGSSVNTSLYTNQKIPALKVQSDIYDRPFMVNLKGKPDFEQSVYEKPAKLFVLSDIEGNFDAFRKLLQANKVIDENFNWTFGRGHLVFNGDMFDRGNQVTECLWLIYSLESKAKDAGGYVHFILGNHEIMNLSGNHAYVREKYLDNASMLKVKYSQLFSAVTELGRWLRTKNIIEKIGDILFVHGGISEEVNELPLSIPEINALARAYFDRDSSAMNSSDKSLTVLFNSDNKYSPFWYRGYYLHPARQVKLNSRGIVDTIYKASTRQIETTLNKYGVKRIVTGHTIVDDSNYGAFITAHYDNKVINVDTRHATGHSEALLNEGRLYFRVNTKGQRVLLFKE